MEKVTIIIETKNAAFKPNPATEICRILADIIINQDLEHEDVISLRDTNGNLVRKLELV